MTFKAVFDTCNRRNDVTTCYQIMPITKSTQSRADNCAACLRQQTMKLRLMSQLTVWLLCLLQSEIQSACEQGINNEHWALCKSCLKQQFNAVRSSIKFGWKNNATQNSCKLAELHVVMTLTLLQQIDNTRWHLNTLQWASNEPAGATTHTEFTTLIKSLKRRHSVSELSLVGRAVPL